MLIKLFYVNYYGFYLFIFPFGGWFWDSPRNNNNMIYRLARICDKRVCWGLRVRATIIITSPATFPRYACVTHLFSIRALCGREDERWMINSRQLTDVNAPFSTRITVIWVEPVVIVFNGTNYGIYDFRWSCRTSNTGNWNPARRFKWQMFKAF